MPKAKQPWIKFYPSDWAGDRKLRACGLAARGLWIECLCVMHEADPYGHLLLNGNPVTDTQLAAMAGTDASTVSSLVAELETMGVLSRRRDGVIYSRRMARDAKKAAIARKNGKSGGNPTLSLEREIRPSDNPPDKPRDKPHIPDARSFKNLESSSLSAAREADPGNRRDAEVHDGAAVRIRPPSENRVGGQRTAGDVLKRMIETPGRREKRLKNQDRANNDMAKWLTTHGGMDGQQAWTLLFAARDPEDPGHTEAARELERISRKHKLGWFAEEAAA